MNVSFEITWKRVGVFLLLLSVFIFMAVQGKGYMVSQPEFCHSCHAMDEPFESWQADPHSAIDNPDREPASCVDCHIPPGEKNSLKVQFQSLRHMFAYLKDPDAPLPIRADIKDQSCLRSGCHAKADFQDREIDYAEGVIFQHKSHFEAEELGTSELSCDNCHVKVSQQEHFEVPQETCFLCHLQPLKPEEGALLVTTGSENQLRPQVAGFGARPRVDFEGGLSKCESCHTIPTKSLQNQIKDDDEGEDPITHQTLQENGVPCISCHIGIVRGVGEVDQGDITSSGCLKCHNLNDELLATLDDKALMHDKHIQTKRADCFDCHKPIEHGETLEHEDYVTEDCSFCHADTHKYQKILLAGKSVVEGITVTPQLMDGVNTNCMGCHIKITQREGHAVMSASAEACESCHGEEEGRMVEKWSDFLQEELLAIEEIKQEAFQAVQDRNGDINEEVLVEINARLSEGQRLLDVVRLGNGVHNKKYSVAILDSAFTQFEDVIDLASEEN